MSKYREICLRQRIWICLKLHVYDVPEHGGELQCLETKKAEMWRGGNRCRDERTSGPKLRPTGDQE